MASRPLADLRWSSCFLLLFPALFAGQSVGSASEDLISEFRAASMTREELSRNFSGECLYRRTLTNRSGGPPIVSGDLFTFAFSGKCGMIGGTANPEVSIGENPVRQRKNGQVRNFMGVIAYNANYSMHVLKKTPQSSFFVKWIENDPTVSQKLMWQGPRRAIYHAVRPGEWSIEQLFALQGFHVEKVISTGETPQDRRIRIDFTISRPEEPKKGVSRIVSGWLITTPAPQWQIREFATVIASSSSSMMTRSSQISYKSDDKMSIPSSIEIREYPSKIDASPGPADSSVKPLILEEFRFTKFRLGEVPDREFTLSGFGLPEFGQTVSQAASSRAYPWWILGAAVGLGILALLLRRLAPRPTKESAASLTTI